MAREEQNISSKRKEERLKKTESGELIPQKRKKTRSEENVKITRNSVEKILRTGNTQNITIVRRIRQK